MAEGKDDAGAAISRRWRAKKNTLFLTLAVGLLDFKVYVALALRPEPGCSALGDGCDPEVVRWGARRVSLQCPAAPNRKLSLQCPTASYACSAQPQSIPVVPNRKESLQCPSAEYHTTLFSPPNLQETLHFLCTFNVSSATPVAPRGL